MIIMGVITVLLYKVVVETIHCYWRALVLGAKVIRVLEALVLHDCAPLPSAGCLCFSISRLHSTVGVA